MPSMMPEQKKYTNIAISRDSYKSLALLRQKIKKAKGRITYDDVVKYLLKFEWEGTKQ